MVRLYAVPIVLLLALAPALQAQITITKTDVENGFVNAQRTRYGHQYQFMAYPMIDLGGAMGSSQTFDFSAIPPGDMSRDTSVQEYQPAAGLPGASDFPGATIGSMYDVSFPGATMTFVEFLSIEDDGVYGHGSYVHQYFPPFIDTVIISKYLPKRLYFPLPITYGTSATWRDTIVDEASGEYEVTVRSFLVDAFGSVTFPPAGGMPVLSKVGGGEQCLRVRTDDVIDVYDSGDNHIAHGHNRDVEFVSTSATILSFSMEDSNYASGSGSVTQRSLDFKSGTTGVRPTPAGVPERFSLSQNYPNPFNPSTMITFAVPSEGFVSLKVYDLLGREVASLVNAEYEAGTYTVDFNAGSLAGGLYFARLTAGSSAATMKMSFVK